MDEHHQSYCYLYFKMQYQCESAFWNSHQSCNYIYFRLYKKPTLKTYVVFDTIVSILEKNSEMINGSIDQREAACCVLTPIISLMAKMGIRAQMAAMYLLGNPDHYTDHKCYTFYWKSHVSEARCPWQMDTEYQKGDKVCNQGERRKHYGNHTSSGLYI